MCVGGGAVGGSCGGELCPSIAGKVIRGSVHVGGAVLEKLWGSYVSFMSVWGNCVGGNCVWELVGRNCTNPPL